LFQGTTIFEIKVRDGDTGIPRKLDLSIVGDTENFFELENLGHSEDGILSASLKKTSGNTLDRELPVRQKSRYLQCNLDLVAYSISRRFGKYSFKLKLFCLCISEHIEGRRTIRFPAQS
jgi:hypothetical protein